MAEKKRQCGTCRFFIQNETGANGRCGHPLRAGADAELLLLRPNELACRTKWGDSLWQDPADDSDPTVPKSPQQPTLPDPIAAQLQFDDEVTSVSIAGSKTSRSSFEDDVVDSGATVTGMASWNDPVQEERLNLLRRGNQDAVAGARKRHIEKKARQRELVPFAEDEEVDRPSTDAKAAEAHEPNAAEQSDANKRSFPPDDFVEDERASGKSNAAEDELVDDGTAPGGQRSPRMRHLLKDNRDPKSDKAMKFSMPSEMRVTSHNPENRSEWNSVPELDPSFELGLFKREAPAVAPQVKMAASSAPMASNSYQPRPVSQAREVKAEDRLRQERAQRQVMPPLAEEPRPQSRASQPVTLNERPRLTHAPETTAEPIERIKSSPLRGYHPATRKLQQPEQEERAPADRIYAAHVPEQKPEKRESRSWNLPPEQIQEQPRSMRPSARAEQPVRQPVREEQPVREQIRPDRSTRQREPELKMREFAPAPRVGEPRSRERSESADRESAQYYAAPQQQMDEYIKEPIEISPNIPRKCATCTSFRSSKTPGRGSCTNRFAGPVDRVVSTNDHACNHTFGSFWLPKDKLVWQVELKAEYPPTPRIDAMLKRRQRTAPTVLPDLDELTS